MEGVFVSAAVLPATPAEYRSLCFIGSFSELLNKLEGFHGPRHPATGATSSGVVFRSGGLLRPFPRPPDGTRHITTASDSLTTRPAAFQRVSASATCAAVPSIEERVPPPGGHHCQHRRRRPHHKKRGVKHH